MNRMYTITMGPHVVRGLISPSELPNLKSDFDWLTKYYGAEMDSDENTLIARKDDIEIILTVGSFHKAIPGKRVLEALVHLMDESFSK